jgi:hypothetical protein
MRPRPDQARSALDLEPTSSGWKLSGRAARTNEPKPTGATAA